MSGPMISSHELKNGLTLKFLDESRKIAADRWYVCVRVRIDIPGNKKWFGDGLFDDDRFSQIEKVLGETVVFSQKKERNFVGDDIKEQVVKEICDQTVDTNMTYMSSDSFAPKFILKAYAEQKQQPSL